MHVDNFKGLIELENISIESLILSDLHSILFYCNGINSAITIKKVNFSNSKIFNGFTFIKVNNLHLEKL